jgi:hypothetical protein
LAEAHNPDGSHNGAVLWSRRAALLHDTEITPEEVTGTCYRLLALMRVEGRTRSEALAIVEDEAGGRPWLAKPWDAP